MKENQQAAGVAFAGLAYMLWGFLPLYWKMLGGVPAGEVLAHRIVWSLIFMGAVLLVLKKIQPVGREIIRVFKNKKSAAAITAAAVLISINWFLFIFAVNSDRVIEASLGYYINPLFNVVLATVFLKEKLTRAEGVAFFLAVGGVITLTFYYGYFPWAAIGLALSFGLYGLIKKTTPLSAWAGLTVETMIMVPFALLFLLAVQGDTGSIFRFSWEDRALLIGAGAATAVPLLLFAASSKRISFSLIGFLQYFAPTIMLLLGVFLFNEPFSLQQLAAFIIVWIGLIIFTISRSRTSWKARKWRTSEKTE